MNKIQNPKFYKLAVVLFAFVLAFLFTPRDSFAAATIKPGTGQCIGYRWQSASATYYISSNFPSYWYYTIYWGKQVWVDVSPCPLVIHEAGTTNITTKNRDGANVILHYYINGTGVGYTYCWGQYNGPNTYYTFLEADVVANSRYDFEFSIGYYDLQSTMAHEFGHFSGLGHSSYYWDTMGIPSQIYGWDRRTLEQGDRDSVNLLYQNLNNPTR